jgi:hypothetical protein
LLTRILAVLAVAVLHASSLAAQQAAPSPTQLTFYNDFVVNPGKEADFTDLVKTVGGPVRDKLMAEGVIKEWGVEVPLLRVPGEATHSVWYVVNDLASVGKVQAAMAEALAKPAATSAAKGAKVMTNAERAREVFDMSKSRNWLMRDLENGYGSSSPAAGAQPFIRYNAVKAKPGKGVEYRRTWDRYSKPVYDKLVADGVVEAWGMMVEDIKTADNFTHIVWVVTPDLAGMDKVRAAFNADRDKRSQEERDAITASFAELIDVSASRSQIAQIVVLKMAGQK